MKQAQRHPFVINRQALAVAHPRNADQGADLGDRGAVNYQRISTPVKEGVPMGATFAAATRPAALHKAQHGASGATGTASASSKSVPNRTTTHKHPPESHRHREYPGGPGGPAHTGRKWRREHHIGNKEKWHPGKHKDPDPHHHKHHKPEHHKHDHGGGGGGGGGLAGLLNSLLGNPGVGSTGTSIPGPTVVPPANNTDSWVGVAVIGLLVSVVGGAVWYIAEHKKKGKGAGGRRHHERRHK